MQIVAKITPPGASEARLKGYKSLPGRGLGDSVRMGKLERMPLPFRNPRLSRPNPDLGFA